MIKTYKEALNLIFKEEKTTKYSLENIIKWLKLLWNPQNDFKIIHIAWTNWKWSVSKMIFSILKEVNKKVGVFTSPHLIDIKERFETETGLINNQEFIQILNKILKLNIDLSYFDKCVMIAFEFFKLKKCEYIILEVWIWWRLDTTNIVIPIITVITSIWLDHQDILWNSLDKISFEKTGIIKENIPVILNIKNDVIKKQASKNNSKIIFTNKVYETNLLWNFQKQNAWLAYKVAKYLNISEKQILSWLQKVKHNWRLEFIKDNILIDWAHNEDSLKELKKYIDKNLKNKYDNIFYCFSIKKGKKISLVIDILWKNKNYILLDIKWKMLEDLSKYSDNYIYESKNYVLEQANLNKKNLYIVFGSLYMIGEFLK
jgi:dihydrofolate synthase / folylpolyglutamate synthase